MPYSLAEFSPRIFRLAARCQLRIAVLLRISSGIWNRHSASICHCGEPYQTESDPKTIRSSPMNFRSWPRMCAATVGKVTTDDAQVVPISA